MLVRRLTGRHIFAPRSASSATVELRKVDGAGEPEFDGEGDRMEFSDTEVWQSLLRQGCQANVVLGQGCGFGEHQSFAETR
jgi:hypothetical protein